MTSQLSAAFCDGLCQLEEVGNSGVGTRIYVRRGWESSLVAIFSFWASSIDGVSVRSQGHEAGMSTGKIEAQ